MRIRVYMKDSRTCYRLAEPSQLADLIVRDPAGEQRSVEAEVASWNPLSGIYLFGPVPVRYIDKASISHVTEDPRTAGEA